jgi:hypothetical protein
VEKISAVFLNGKRISDLVLVDFNIEEGWVEIEDLSSVPSIEQYNNSPLTDVSEVTVLPTKKLYGKVEVRTAIVDTRSQQK